MKKLSALVFDDFIHGAGAVVYTSNKLEDLLSAADKLALHAVADQVTTSGQVTVQVEHSCDRRNWIAKNVSAEINAAALTQGSTTQAWGYDDGTRPTLAFVRLKITMSTSTLAHLKLYVTGRDN